MASRPPPPPSSFSGIAVDDMLALPGIQEVLTTDAPEVQDEITNEEGAGSSSVVFRPSEELDSEKQLLGERQTTRSMYGEIFVLPSTCRPLCRYAVTTQHRFV